MPMRFKEWVFILISTMKEEGRMKKIIIPGCAALFSAVLLFTCFANEAHAQDTQGKWGIGIRGGMAFLSQDVAEETKGKEGPIVSGNILYGLTNTLSVGLNAEWEKHRVEAVGQEFGDATTVSVIPFAEFHALGLGAFSPYLSLGLGLNLNSFSRNSFGNLAFTKVDPKETISIKAGGGADYFATRNLALNAEVGWKGNPSKVDVCGPSIGCGTDDWKMSVFSVLLGLRYYF